MTKTKCFLGISGLMVGAVLATMTVRPAAAEELYRRILSVDAGGAAVTIRAEDGKSNVKLKVVDGKTTLEQGAKDKKPIQMSALKAEMVCNVTYTGDTAEKVSCDPEATE